jgi:putative membrane protein
MKKWAVWLVTLSAAVVLTACGERATEGDVSTTEPGGQTESEPMGETPTTAPGAAMDASTRQFVENMARTNIAEVELGRLAAQNGMSADVKQFGQTMVDEHTKANEELKSVASSLNMALPSETDQEHRELIDRLSKLKGAEFDREYTQAMVEGHREVVNELERHAQAGAPATPGTGAGDGTAGTAGTAGRDNQAVRDWAAKTLPDVRGHLERAEQINAKLRG